MLHLGLQVLKSRFGEYVRLAARGESILITDHDRVVAILGPATGRAELMSDAFLSQAVRDGRVSPPMIVCNTPPPRLPVAPLDELVGELALDRSDG